MKKKLGEISIIDHNTGDILDTLTVWGTLFKGENSKYVTGGIYVSFKPENIDTEFPLIKKLMDKHNGLRLKFNSEFWGEYYNLGTYGNPKYTDFEQIIRAIKQVNCYSFDKYDVQVKIQHNFQYVVDANIVEKI